MKQIVAVLFGIINISNLLFATENQEPAEKIYVDPQHIVMHENNLFVNLHQIWVRTNALYSDAEGLYVTSNSAWPLPFCCDRCGRWNSGFNAVCEYCGTPRSD